ncbi:hypothetical protein FACS189419_08300 [Planctomycetales bacterium]|nr:hypothetical protein FACS189419_08300 [Planctomycetales bacterium]
MEKAALNLFLILFVLAGLSSLTLNGAEIRLKSGLVHSKDSLVALADVAEILPSENENVDSLKSIILFPAPSEGEQLLLSRQELRSTLSQLGVNFTKHVLTGVPQITVNSSVPGGQIGEPHSGRQFVIKQANYVEQNRNPFPHDTGFPPIQRADINQKIEGNFIKILEKQVAESLNIYLNFTNKIQKSWEVSLHLTSDQAKILASNGQIEEITGGAIPFTGIQNFTIRMQTNVTVSVEATISLPTEIVVLRRSVPKGHIITEGDLMMKKVDKIKNEDFITDVNEAVGKETLKAVMEMNPLSAGVLRLPVLVRKGEIVTVRAANGGIVVRTEAEALQDGVLGDTISVERIDASPKGLTPKARGKKTKEQAITFLARICAPKMVEVYVK